MDTPENTTILGAFKLTGKTRDGWSVGLMESITQQEKAEISDGSESKKAATEPLTNYFAGRIEKDIHKGNTIIGGMITATNRDIKDSAINYLADAAYTGGVNFTQYWKNRMYMLRVKGTFSHLRGDSTTMKIIKESPVHYYQRPDADYITYDPSRTTLSLKITGRLVEVLTMTEMDWIMVPYGAGLPWLIPVPLTTGFGLNPMNGKN